MKKNYPSFAAPMLALLLFDALFALGIGLAPIAIILFFIPLAIVNFLIAIAFPKNYSLAKAATPQGRPWSMLSRLCLNHNLVLMVTGSIYLTGRLWIENGDSENRTGLGSLLFAFGVYVMILFMRFILGSFVSTMLSLYGLLKAQDSSDRRRLWGAVIIGMLALGIGLGSDPDFLRSLLFDEDGGVGFSATVGVLSIFYSWGTVCFLTAVFGKSESSRLDPEVASDSPGV